MGKVYRNCTVPIPLGSLIYGGKVFDPPKGPIREILIGYVVSPSMMYPNDSYFRLHRSEWLAYNPDGQYMVCPFTLKVGLYSLITLFPVKSAISAPRRPVPGRTSPISSGSSPGRRRCRTPTSRTCPPIPNTAVPSPGRPNMGWCPAMRADTSYRMSPATGLRR